MSRIGKMPVPVPSGVNVTFKGNVFTAKGPRGENTVPITDFVKIKIEDGIVYVSPNGDKNNKKIKEMWGLTRALINNAVAGVDKDFEKVLDIVGVGYRADLKGKKLVLQVGYSHPVEFDPPEGVVFAVEGQTRIRISGHNRHDVGEMAAKIRAARPPEPYKGKGIRYVDEYVRTKAGKSAT